MEFFISIIKIFENILAPFKYAKFMIILFINMKKLILMNLYKNYILLKWKNKIKGL